MATISLEELARQYAGTVRDAFNRSYSVKAASDPITERFEASLSISVTIREAIKEIAADLDSRVIVEASGRRRPLTEREREYITELAGEVLGLTTPEEFYYSTKSASNNSYLELVNHVSEMLKELLKNKGK